MITKSATRSVLLLFEKERDRALLTWDESATGIGVTKRTLQHAQEWYRTEGEYGHRPSRVTVRSIAKWLRKRGVEVAIG